MVKKTDLQFDNVEKFLKDNPHFSITKPTPNYAAIRAILRTGQEIEGVRIVEVPAKEDGHDTGEGVSAAGSTAGTQSGPVAGTGHKGDGAMPGFIGRKNPEDKEADEQEE